MSSESAENIKPYKGSKKEKKVSTKHVNVKNEEGNRPVRVKYKKRGGTSGATGQLYESKLLSLVLFRCLTDDEIEEFLIGSNVVGVGDLDDICLRFTCKGKQVAAFIQSKHKDDSSKGITDVHLYGPKSKVNLLKCFESYLQTRNQFNTHNDKKDIFRGNLENVELHFIVYTSAVNKLSKEKIKVIDESNSFTKLRKIVSCKDRQEDVFQLAYDDNDVNIVSNVLIYEQIEIIAKAFVDCFRDKGANFEVFRKYLNILVPDVIILTEDETCNIYVASFNPNFFYATDEIIIKLRQSIYKHALANTKLNKDQQELILYMLLYGEYESDKSKHLIKIIGNTIVFDEKNNKLIFNPKIPQSLVTKFGKRLNDFNYYFHEITKNMIDEAIQIAGKELLQGEFIHIPKWAIDINDLKKIDKKLFFATEISVAEDFLRKLYFFTNQGQEKDVADKLVTEISYHLNKLENRCFKNRTRADIAFLKFHDKVQKWWLLNNNSYYQSKTCDYLDQLPHEISQSFTDMLDFKYRHEINKKSVEFKPESIKNIKFGSSKITNVVTRSLLLTSIKLQQFFSNFIYIDFQHLYYLRDSEWATLKEELKYKKDLNLVLVCKISSENASDTYDIFTWLIGKVIDAFPNNIVIVSNVSLSVINNTFSEEANSVCIDKNITFTDLTIETQNKLLQYEIHFQGQIILLNQLLGNDSCIISTDIIHRILDNTPIVLGQSLSNPSYENIKKIYVPRTLAPRIKIEEIEWYYNERYTEPYHSSVNILRTFKDSDKHMNIIAAEPGMGKSTMLTHLSIETKKQYPEIWIVRLNLLDYCDDFQNMGTEVSLLDFLKLILKSNFGDISEFTIDDVDGDVSVQFNGNDNLKLFELEMMMHCYNNDNMIFIFDGFDEICPDYQTQVTSFIKNAKPDYYIDDQGSTFNLMELFYASNVPKRFQVWLTSRPYNVIIQQLEKDFGPSFVLKSLSEKEQNYFYDKYWSVNFKASEIDMQQFRNIESFFKFMSQFRDKLGKFSDHFHATDVPLYEMYISAVRYFRNQILHMPLKVDKETILNDWITDKELRLKLAASSLTRGTDITNAQQILGVPLYMDMAARYFVSEIKNDKEMSPMELDLGFTTFSYYKRFIELKLKVRFVEKNDMKISRPDVKSMCNAERNNFMDTHKKLAFYAMMHRSKYYLKKMISKPEIVKIKKTIEIIKNGKEKTGLIERIHNDVPRFVHLTFAEYFAVEFIVDKIIAKKPNIKVLMDYILNYLLRQGTIGLRTIFDQKLKSNDKQLNEVLTEPAVKKIVFDLMMEQKDKTESTISNFDDVETANIEPSLDKAIDNNLNNVVMFLISSLDGNLNVGNIDTVIEYFGRSYFIGTMLIGRPELIEYVLDQVRLIDESKIKKVISVCNVCVDSGDKIENVDILNALYNETRHMTTPYYAFDDFDEAF